MKPYTALFGTLKVADEVGVEIDASCGPRLIGAVTAHQSR